MIHVLQKLYMNGNWRVKDDFQYLASMALGGILTSQDAQDRDARRTVTVEGKIDFFVAVWLDKILYSEENFLCFTFHSSLHHFSNSYLFRHFSVKHPAILFVLIFI